MAEPPSALLIAWLLAPLLAAFTATLLPFLARPLALLSALLTMGLGLALSSGAGPWDLEFIGPLGVALQFDAAAAPFVLLNGLVVLAVLLDGWRTPFSGPFPSLLMVLLGGLNSAFVVVDLVSLYVALEVVGIAAFLLMLGRRSGLQLWIGLRYLLLGNTVMVVYLLGVALLYLREGSFRLSALADPALGDGTLAVILALLLVGLLTKAGVFASGLWLPRTHAEAPAEVSALLSGVVVAAGLCPLLRISGILPLLQPALVWLGLASALLGVVYALAETDLKRLLAWSTLSQVGLVLLDPTVGGLYALAHGLAKAGLFLLAGRLGERNLQRWRLTPLPLQQAVPLWLGSLSIAGAPLLLGYWAKEGLSRSLSGPAAAVLLLVMVGTAAVYARLLLRPLARFSGWPPLGSALLALVLLASGLLLAPLPPQGSLLKALAVLAAGVGLELLLELSRRAPAAWPRLALPKLERLDDLLGGMAVIGAALMLVLLGGGLAWPA
ncbi:MAG: proton-conducting transporter membrane subunit [Prochlorococcaceae cyanobacterium]